MATDGSYLQMYASFRSRVNYDELFPASIRKLSGDVNFSSVKSCLMFGPGEGDHELQFIKQCAPNINKLIAVEPDHESVERLRARLANSLPDVDSQVIETTIQRWNGLDDQVDLVLMMKVLYYVSSNERKELFKKLHEQWLTAGGRVVVVSASRTQSPGNANKIFELLGTPLLAWEDIEADFLEAGFIRQHAHEIQFTLDFCSLDESCLRFFQYQIDQPVTCEDVRNVIKDMFPGGKSGHMFSTFAVFQKA